MELSILYILNKYNLSHIYFTIFQLQLLNNNLSPFGYLGFNLIL